MPVIAEIGVPDDVIRSTFEPLRLLLKQRFTMALRPKSVIRLVTVAKLRDNQLDSRPVKVNG